jgi:hypothetical protein
MKTGKKPTPAVSVSENGNACAPEEVIRKRAYELYEQRGYADGMDVQDWLAAEEELHDLTPA